MLNGRSSPWCTTWRRFSETPTPPKRRRRGVTGDASIGRGHVQFLAPNTAPSKHRSCRDSFEVFSCELVRGTPQRIALCRFTLGASVTPSSPHHLPRWQLFTMERRRLGDLARSCQTARSTPHSDCLRPTSPGSKPASCARLAEWNEFSRSTPPLRMPNAQMTSFIAL